MKTCFPLPPIYITKYLLHPLTGALFQCGGALPQRSGLVPSPDALHSPRSTDSGKDPRLLRSSSGSCTSFGHEPCCPLATHCPGPSWEADLWLHPGSAQPPNTTQALQAPRGAPTPQGPYWSWIQGTAEEPLSPAPCPLVGGLPQGADPRGGRRCAYSGSLPWAEEGREVSGPAAQDQPKQFLLQHHQGLLLPPVVWTRQVPGRV